MKILMINSVCGVGSTGRICTDLALELEKQGHKVKIAYGRGSSPKQFDRFAVKIGSDTDVKLHGVKARLFDASGFGSKRATERFISWVKEYDPDVIHLHNIHGYYINIKTLFDYLKTAEKRVLWTLHDCWAFTGHSAYCDSVSCEKWKNSCGNCPLKSAYPKSVTDFSKRNRKLKEEIFTNVNNMTLVTPSEWLRGLTKQSFLGEYPVELIRNGIDTEVFKRSKSDFREKFGLTDKKLLLGVSSQWDEFKGFDDFFKLSNELDDSYRIVLVGVTKEQKESLPENIIGIESTDNVNELVGIYSSVDCLVNLSYSDNFPTVNIEAVACGIPVVTYDVGGSVESAFGNALKVKKGDHKAAADVIKNGAFDIKVSVDRKSIDKTTALQSYLNQYQKL